MGSHRGRVQGPNAEARWGEVRMSDLVPVGHWRPTISPGQLLIKGKVRALSAGLESHGESLEFRIWGVAWRDMEPRFLTIAQSRFFHHIAPVPGPLDAGPHTEEVTCAGIEAADNGAGLLRPGHVYPQRVSRAPGHLHLHDVLGDRPSYSLWALPGQLDLRVGEGLGMEVPGGWGS